MTRDRLVAPLLTSALGIIEAGAGFGKSVLASQLRHALGLATVYVPLGPPDDDEQILVASLRRALRRARLSDLLAATGQVDANTWVDRFLDVLVDTPEGVLVILDDAHHLHSASSTALVARLARGLPAQHHALIAARSLRGSLEPLRRIEGSVSLDTRALAFTTDETAALVRARSGYEVAKRELSDWIESTHGWATALVLAAATYRPGNGPIRQLSSSDLISGPIRGILETMGAEERRATIELAHLPFFSAEICDAVAGFDGALDRIVSAGVPVARTNSGWWELPSPVADHLAAQAPVAARTVLTAAELYARDGEGLAAIRLLLDADLYGEAATKLAAMSPIQVEELGLALVQELVEALPDTAVSAYPRVLLHLARVAEIAHRADVRSAALTRASTVGAGHDGELDRELDAEQARDLMWDERTRDTSRLLARRVLEQAQAGEIVARARALDVLGRLGTWFSEGNPRPEAEAQFQESARLARRAGQRTWAAQALIPLAMGFYFATCRYDRALGVLAEALSDLPARNRYRMMVQAFRAELLVEVGRFSEAESCLAEVRDVGRSSGEAWIAAYASWGEANIASYRMDAAGTVEAVLDVERHRDEWYEQPSGVEFLAQASDFLSRVGEHQQAFELLDRAQQRMAGTEHPVRVYAAAVVARSGDPGEAEAMIEPLLAEGALEPQERWPLLLLRAHAARRRGSPVAGELAALAFDTCRELGHPDGPLIRERAIAETLLPLAAGAGSRAASALQRRTGALSITLLGGFEIARAGLPVPLPPGRPARAVRAVAAAGGRLHADELIEILWSGSSPETGRSRLRNLLSRLRIASGEILERDGEMIRLIRGHDLDIERFARESSEALTSRSAGDEQRSVGLARSALARYRGDLLPEDRYEDWTTTTREQLRSSYLDLLDLVSATAEHRGDFDETSRMLRRAIEVDPYDEQRYVRLARLLWSQGRAGSALAALRRARAALAELQLSPSSELEGLEAEMGQGR